MNTLKKRSEFLYVAQKKLIFRSKTVLVQGAVSSLEAVRFGFTASRKVGNAVHRNLAKRRLRELARKFESRISFGDFVLIALRETGSCDFADLSKDVETGILYVFYKLKKLS